MKSRPSLLVAAAAALLFSPEIAHADGPVALPSPALLAPPPPPPRVATEWYGWETLIVDGAAAAVAAAAIATDRTAADGPLGAGAGLAYVFGPPVVHAAHRRWGIAAADFGIRVGAVIVGALLTGAVGSGIGVPCSGDGCDPSLNGLAYGMFIGAGLGALTASAIDASVLAREKVRPEAASANGLTWGPSLRMVREGAVGGVSGTF